MENYKITPFVFPDGRMTTESAASYLGYSVKTLAMMRCKGTGPKFIKQGRIYYFKDDLDTWVSQFGRVRSTAQARIYKQNGE